MVVLGGSITCGGDTRHLEEQWPYRVFMWINSAFPHADHTFSNLCKSATPSMVVAACLQSSLPKEVDFVLMEVRSCLHPRQHMCYHPIRQSVTGVC